MSQNLQMTSVLFGVFRENTYFPSRKSFQYSLFEKFYFTKFFKKRSLGERKKIKIENFDFLSLSEGAIEFFHRKNLILSSFGFVN